MNEQSFLLNISFPRFRKFIRDRILCLRQIRENSCKFDNSIPLQTGAKLSLERFRNDSLMKLQKYLSLFPRSRKSYRATSRSHRNRSPSMRRGLSKFTTSTYTNRWSIEFSKRGKLRGNGWPDAD